MPIWYPYGTRQSCWAISALAHSVTQAKDFDAHKEGLLAHKSAAPPPSFHQPLHHELPCAAFQQDPCKSQISPPPLTGAQLPRSSKSAGGTRRRKTWPSPMHVGTTGPNSRTQLPLRTTPPPAVLERHIWLHRSSIDNCCGKRAFSQSAFQTRTHT